MTQRVWIAKQNLKVEKGECPEKTMVDFGRKFGRRGIVTLSENVREGDHLVFQRGCRMLKGSYADVLKQAVIWADDDIVNHQANASEDKPPKPEAYRKALSYLSNAVASKDAVVEIEDDNGNTSMGHTQGWLLKWETRARQHQVFVRKSKDLPWKKIEEFQQGPQTRQFIVYLAKILPKYIRAEVTSSQDILDMEPTRLKVTAAGELPDRVASIIFGDLKRIRSTIASWQGKMKPEEYKLFVEYEKSIAKHVRDKFVPKMSKEYREKIAKL